MSVEVRAEMVVEKCQGLSWESLNLRVPIWNADVLIGMCYFRKTLLPPMHV